MKETSQNLFNDIDLSFKPHPVTGDVTKLKNTDAVLTSVKNLVLTFNGERPFNPAIGSRVRAMLFEPMSTLTEKLIADEIRNTLENWEPRVLINKIEVFQNFSEDGYNVSVIFNIINDFTDLKIDLFLSRLR